MTKAGESGGWEQDVPESGRSGSTFGKRTPNVKQADKAKVVRDDWDDDDDDEGEVEAEQKRDVNSPVPVSADPTSAKTREREGGEEDSSSKIWEEANRRAPMPELIVAPASTSQWVPAPPPAAALQPTLRILKRPASNASTGYVGAVGVSSAPSPPSSASGPTSRSGSLSGATSPMPRGTLAEREAQYQEARNRIFGDREKEKLGGASASPGSVSRTSSSSGSGGVAIVRDPLGPAVPASEPEMDPTKEEVRRPVRGFGERRRGKKQSK